MNPKRAFTLIELLVVIAIIGIIVALLLPVLNSAKKRAQRTACMNNLRQINLGVRMYSDDSSDKAPHTPYTATSPSFVDWTGYRKLIGNYVGLNGNVTSSPELFACPADVFFYDLHRNGRGYVSQSLHNQADSDHTSYGFNGGTRTVFGTDTPGIGGKSMSSIKHPERTVLVAEFPAYCPWSWHQPREPRAQSPWIFNNARNVVSFLDGHVSYIEIYWNGEFRYPTGASSLALEYDPPARYDYQWSGD
ncbi:MAG TPA: prepilin-type N-terminal cleavage/methylation domain-containing protein [Candidatus Acidoferrales bacterium]|jgi:prepilin-type N-terminal cleavage/methylation domain-containing protein|nr:prepilin-type N-terminal cleavage/methylation domain-containing protein [Candidatus Acidoferrales bacterium]